LDLNGNDTGNRKGLLEWLLETFKGVEVKCKKKGKNETVPGEPGKMEYLYIQP
jgi:hypothetical protein